MEFIILATIIIAMIARIYFLNKSDKKRRQIEEERKRQEEIKYQAKQAKKQEQLLALIQQNKLEEKKKLDEESHLEKIRLQKMEDEKYETFTIVAVGLNNDRYTCVLRRQNNTYAYVESPKIAFQLNVTVKLLKEEANDFGWISEAQHIKKQEEVKEKKEREEEIARQNALQAIETEQRSLCESNTTYCSDIEAKYIKSPRDFGLTSIRSLSAAFYYGIPEEIKTHFFTEL